MKDKINGEIINNIRYLFAEHAIDSISQVSRMSSLNRKTIEKIKNNIPEDIDTITFKSLRILCDTFQCKLSELLEYIPDSYCQDEEKDK